MLWGPCDEIASMSMLMVTLPHLAELATDALAPPFYKLLLDLHGLPLLQRDTRRLGCWPQVPVLWQGSRRCPVRCVRHQRLVNILHRRR